MKANLPIAASDFDVVIEGPEGVVRLSPSVMDRYLKAIEGTDEISVRRKTHLGRYFKTFCEQKEFTKFLGEEKFKKQGSFRTSKGVTVAVWEFKAWQWRVYGGIFSVVGKRTFVGVEVDADKKKDKADRAKLLSAAEILAGLTDYR